MVGLFFQQAIALFVLKSDAGFHMFKWLATLVSDFLDQSLVGATFFFDQDTVNKHWFFVNTVRCCTRRLRRKEMASAYSLAIAFHYHFLHRMCAVALLSRRYAVGHQTLCLVLL